MHKIKRILPGFLVSVLVALGSMFLARFIPKLGAATISIFLGMFVGNLFLHQPIFSSGYKFSESDVLSYSIVLLGATLSINTLLALGVSGFLYIIIQMGATIIAAIFIGKRLGFSENFTYLMAAGNAVCGSSAIASTAPVIDADDKDKGISITIVNVTGVVLMLLLPFIANILYGHEALRSSALIGGTLQSVGQVVASASMISEEIKDISMLFKILRVVLLVGVVFLFGHLKSKSNAEIIEEEEEAIKKKKASVPWYVIGFFVTCGLFSFGLISPELSLMCKEVSNKLEIIALAAIGLRVNIKDLIKQGKQVSLYAVFIGTFQVACAIFLIWILRL